MISDGRGDGDPWVVLVQVHGLTGCPFFDFGEDSGGVERGVPVESLLIDLPSGVAFVLAEESSGDPAGRVSDDGSERCRRLERRDRKSVV